MYWRNRIYKRKNVFCNSSVRNNNEFKNDLNNCTYGYTPYSENGNKVIPDNSNEIYMKNIEYPSADQIEKPKDSTNSCDSCPAPVYQKDEKNFPLFTISETKN